MIRHIRIPVIKAALCWLKDLEGQAFKIQSLEREFKKELTTKEIRSRIDADKLFETSKDFALNELRAENIMLRDSAERLKSMLENMQRKLTKADHYHGQETSKE